MEHQNRKLLHAPNYLGPDGTIQSGTLVLRGSRIETIQPNTPASLLLQDEEVELINLPPHSLLAPGLIDLQCNGAFGIDFSTAAIADILHVLEHLPGYGLTSIYPTLVSAPIDDLLTAVHTLEEVFHFPQSTHTQMGGIHLEGPFLNPAFAGTHPKGACVEATLDKMQTLLSPNVKLISMAPEMDPEELVIPYLKQLGIRVFAGHTGASPSQLARAKQIGLTGLTHLFNAMSPFHHRNPGILVEALLDPDLYVTLIADGQHLHPDTLRLVRHCKPSQSIILVSDLMPLAGLEEGSRCTFAGTTVTLQHGKALNLAGDFAGSVCWLKDCITRLVGMQLTSLAEALQWATLNPATAMGINDEVGSLAPGKMAHFTLWDKDSAQLLETWIDGKKVYDHQHPFPQRDAQLLKDPLQKFSWQGQP